MNRVGTVLRRIGKILLGVLLVLAVLVGAFLVWLRRDPQPVTECESGFRLFEHAQGATCVPEAPSRILAYSTTISQLMVATERPMAMLVDDLDTFTAADIPGLYERLRQVNEGGLDLGRVNGGAIGPNLELLLQIEPDLIVSEWVVSDDVAKAAGVIAPVVFLTDLESWKEVTVRSGDIIGEQQRAEDLIEAYEGRVELLRQQFDDPAEITISNVRLFEDRAGVQLPASFAGQVISEVGFSFPEPQLALVEDTPERFQIDFSEERLDLIDADFLFIFVGSTEFVMTNLGVDGPSLIDEFQSDPLFQFLSAAESGKVHEVDMHWTVPGIYSAHFLLDDLFRYVAGVDPEEVSPNPLLLK
ncbi:MAG: ABC transporter substrate-binding protein [Chloroflexota bacterium]